MAEAKEPKERRRGRRSTDTRASSDSQSAAPTVPRNLAALLDDALGRMERRASGDEPPVSLPWPNVAEALGGGFWGGHSVALLGNTGSGKTQWALQAALHAAESGVPVCYVALDLSLQQVVARLLGLKADRRWVDLLQGHAGEAVLDEVRRAHAGALRALPFHLVEDGGAGKTAAPDIRRLVEWMRREYPEGKPGTRPVLLVVDFLQLTGGREWDVRDMMGKAAREARAAARDLDAVILLVSASSRENYARTERREKPIGVHRDRRRPAPLGEGSPARLLGSGKELDEAELASDVVVVLAEERWSETKGNNPSTRVWCAIARNRAGEEAWCALRFDGNRFEVDASVSPEQPHLDFDGGASAPAPARTSPGRGAAKLTSEAGGRGNAAAPRLRD